MNASKNRFWILVTAVLLIGTLVLFHWVGNNGYPILLVIPNRFIGPIEIIEDASAPPIPFVDNQYVVKLPASGVLRVRSIAPFNEWHQSKACYSDGTELICTHFPTDEPDKVALRCGGGRSSYDARGRTIKSIFEYVGTVSQYQAALQQRK